MVFTTDVLLKCVLEIPSYHHVHNLCHPCMANKMNVHDIKLTTYASQLCCVIYHG